MFFKKNIRNITIILICAAFIAAIFIVTKETLSRKSDSYSHRVVFFAMDTFVDVRSDSDIASDIKEIVGGYDAALDCDDESGKTEASKLNSLKEIDGSAILSDTIRSVLALNDKYGTLTDITAGGLTKLWNVTAENPVVPDENDIRTALETVGIDNISVNSDKITLKGNTVLDFGAVGKGAALDGCFSYLKENNCEKTVISTGSSVLFYGGDSFEVSIADPDGNGTLAAVDTNRSFISTSGGYERYFEADGKTYCHIIDPRTGYPAETDLTTVTVFCDSGIESDFLSTTIFLEGSENINKYLYSSEYKIFAADKNKKLYISDGVDYEIHNKRYSE